MILSDWDIRGWKLLVPLLDNVSAQDATANGNSSSVGSFDSGSTSSKRAIPEASAARRSSSDVYSTTAADIRPRSRIANLASGSIIHPLLKRQDHQDSALSGRRPTQGPKSSKRRPTAAPKPVHIGTASVAITALNTDAVSAPAHSQSLHHPLHAEPSNTQRSAQVSNAPDLSPESQPPEVPKQGSHSSLGDSKRVVFSPLNRDCVRKSGSVTITVVQRSANSTSGPKLSRSSKSTLPSLPQVNRTHWVRRRGSQSSTSSAGASSFRERLSSSGSSSSSQDEFPFSVKRVEFCPSDLRELRRQHKIVVLRAVAELQNPDPTSSPTQHISKILAVATQPSGKSIVLNHIGNRAQCLKLLQRLLFLADEEATKHHWVLPQKLPLARLLCFISQSPSFLPTIQWFLRGRDVHGASGIRLLVVRGCPIFKTLGRELISYINKIHDTDQHTYGTSNGQRCALRLLESLVAKRLIDAGEPNLVKAERILSPLQDPVADNSHHIPALQVIRALLTHQPTTIAVLSDKVGPLIRAIALLNPGPLVKCLSLTVLAGCSKLKAPRLEAPDAELVQFCCDALLWTAPWQQMMDKTIMVRASPSSSSSFRFLTLLLDLETLRYCTYDSPRRCIHHFILRFETALYQNLHEPTPS